MTIDTQLSDETLRAMGIDIETIPKVNPKGWMGMDSLSDRFRTFTRDDKFKAVKGVRKALASLQTQGLISQGPVSVVQDAKDASLVHISFKTPPIVGTRVDYILCDDTVDEDWSNRPPYKARSMAEVAIDLRRLEMLHDLNERLRVWGERRAIASLKRIVGEDPFA